MWLLSAGVWTSSSWCIPWILHRFLFTVFFFFSFSSFSCIHSISSSSHSYLLLPFFFTTVLVPPPQTCSFFIFFWFPFAPLSRLLVHALSPFSSSRVASVCVNRLLDGGGGGGGGERELQRAGPHCSFIRNFQRVSISPSRLQYELFPGCIQLSAATQLVFTRFFYFLFYTSISYSLHLDFGSNWQEWFSLQFARKWERGEGIFFIFMASTHLQVEPHFLHFFYLFTLSSRPECLFTFLFLPTTTYSASLSISTALRPLSR